jgi:molybdopterin-dependent oxidoreductase-like protein protein
MAGRRTNLALLGGLVLAFVTGWLAFGAGTARGRWIVVAHGLAGMAILVLTPWKSVIVRRGLARPRRDRSASVALGVLVVVALATGLLHATGLARSLGPVTSMMVHVGAALLAVPVAVRHVRTRPQRPRRSDLGRRGFLRAGAVLGAAGLVWAATDGLVRLASLPGARRRFTGSYEKDAAAMPVTQWLDDDVQDLDPAAWRLRVVAGGAVREWTWPELAAFDDNVRATLDCTGGWYALQDWQGARLDRLLPALPASGSITVTSATGYGRRFPVAEAPRLLLATRAGGRPLSKGHGFPARLVAPGRRGFHWVKWVERVEVSTSPPWLQPPFPLT